LKSPEWDKRRRHKISLANGKCQKCGATGEELQVHHLTYARLGNEKGSDLIVLCKPCHHFADIERRNPKAKSPKKWNAKQQPMSKRQKKKHKQWVAKKRARGM